MKERKIKGVGPSTNGDDAMSSKVENKIVTKWKSMKKKIDSHLEVDLTRLLTRNAEDVSKNKLICSSLGVMALVYFWICKGSTTSFIFVLLR